MASPSSNQSSLGGFILTPAKTDSLALQYSSTVHQPSAKPGLEAVSRATAALGSAYRTLDEDLLSPPPYPSRTDTSGSETAKEADISSKPTSAPEDGAGSALSAQAAALGIQDTTRDKIPATSALQVPSPQVDMPFTVNAQLNAGALAPTTEPTTTNYVIVNGVKYVPEQPTMVIPAIASSAGNAQQDNDVNPLEPVPNIETPSQIKGLPTSYFDEISSTPVKVLFEKDPTVFYVHTDLLRQLLGREITDTMETDLSKGEMTLEDVAPWCFNLILRFLYCKPAESDMKLSTYANLELATLYMASRKFGQDWLSDACLDAISIEMPVEQFVADLKGVYDRGQADAAFREVFRLSIRDCLRGGAHSANPRDQFARETALGGMLASDIAMALVDEVVDGAQSTYVGEDARVVKQASNSEERGNWNDNSPSNASPVTNICFNCCRDLWICSCHSYGQADVVDTPNTARPRSDWVETAPQSEPERDGWGAPIRRSNNEWSPVGPREPEGLDNAVHARERLHHPRDNQGPTHGNNWGWAGVQASSDRIETVSATEIANDDWVLNRTDNNDNWDTTNAGQLLPTSIKTTWDRPGCRLDQSLPQAPDATQHPSAMPQRRLPPPSESSASSHPPPVAPVAKAAPTKARRSLAPETPFPPPSPPSTTALPDFHIPPIGMPNYVYPFGYIRSAHVGNGMIHPTAPGLYGLAGRTMIATRNSDYYTCSLYFRAGDVITNVVNSNPLPPSYSSLYGAHVLQGICRGRSGSFPADFVSDVRPPVVRQLGSPFAPTGPKKSWATVPNHSGWGTPEAAKERGSAAPKQAYVSDAEGEDDDGRGGGETSKDNGWSNGPPKSWDTGEVGRWD